MVAVHPAVSPHTIVRARSDSRAVSEQIIGELFGWELADGEPSSDCRTEAILTELLPRYRRGDAATQRFPELAPSKVVDACLGRLVAIARSEFEASSPTQLRAPLREIDVRERVVARIHADAQLTHRARTLRKIAAAAEAELERFYSSVLLERLHKATPQRFEAPHGVDRVRRLSAYLSEFPYVDNYVHLVHAELALLRANVTPLYLRDRELMLFRAAERESALHMRAGAARELAAARKAARKPLREHRIAVCGCGPLPLTGLALHAFTGARVTLIDIDPQSAARAEALVRELERLGVLDRSAVQVLVADAAKPSAWAHDSDIVLVASLVPLEAKRTLMHTLPSLSGRRHVELLLRSAAGLCAELIYEPVPTASLSSLSLPFCGESVPAHLVAVGLTDLVAAVRGATGPSSSELIVTAHESVLNTTELYCTVPHAAVSGV